MLQYIVGFNNFVVFDSNKYNTINTNVFKAWVSRKLFCVSFVYHIRNDVLKAVVSGGDRLSS